MPTTSSQDAKFKETLIPNSLLEDAIDWIQSNMSPEEVFAMNDLVGWAEDNVDKIHEKFLIEWAESNGYTKE